MKKFLVVVTSFLLLVLFVVGCGKSGSGSAQRVTLNIGGDPKTIDPQKNTTVEGTDITVAVFEGLYSGSKNGNPVPAVAESVKISKDGKVYTFKLRKDAKWSDGKPVTAQDFEYTFKRGADPATMAEYAYQFFYIKNAEKFNQGKASRDDVGVKSLDDYTLQVTLENPTPYFLGLVGQAVYYPVRKDIVEKDPEGWTLKAETFIGNGPFKMVKIAPKEGFEFVKNENYWDKANVKLDELKFTTIADENTYLNAFKKGEIDVFDTPPLAEIPNLLKDGTAKLNPYLASYFYAVNVSGKNVPPEVAKFLGNAKVRRALALAIDRKMIVEEVLRGGQIPGTSFVPKGIVSSDGKEFTTKQYFSPTGNVQEAKKLLAEAGYGDAKKMPTISIKYNTLSSHATVAQAIQDMWKKNLGVNTELKQEEWAAFISSRVGQNYEVARHGWTADYNDPMTFLDLWVSSGGNNDAKYNSPAYDKYIKMAKSESNATKRTKLLHDAEDVLMKDMPIIPLYYYTRVVCANPKVKNWYLSPLGEYNFKNAYVEVAAK
ncbi:MAG: peptide ABC transporter substrate-binding protein [Fusobacteriaceae bacterium]